MKKDLKSIKRKFIFYQYLVFTITVAVLTAFLIFYCSKIASEFNLNHIEQLADIVTEQIKITQEMPTLSYRKDLIVFVISKKTGEFVFPREEGRDPHQGLWDSYRAKLIYEMQKQNQGWIFYPDHEMNGAKADSHVIRYTSLENLGWIVVTEVILDYNLKGMFNPFDWKFLGPLLMITIISFLVIRLLTNRNYYLFKNEFAKLLENNLMSLGQKETPYITPKHPMPPLDLSKLVESGEHYTTINSTKKEPSQTKTSLVPIKETAEPTYINVRPPILSKSSVPFEFKVTEQKVQKESVKLKQQIDPELDNLKIDINGIRSPILKKMIEELRED